MDEFKRNFDKLVSESKSIMICSHIRPDSDAITSLLSVYKYLSLKYSGKSLYPVFEGIAPVSEFGEITGFKDLKWSDNLVLEYIPKVDLAIFVDGSTVDRFTYNANSFSDLNIKTICIDHHKKEGDFHTIELIDTSMASTTQLLADRVIEEDYWSEDIIELLMIGLIGDTGHFTFIRPNNSSALITAKRLVDKGNLDLEEFKLKSESYGIDSFNVFKEVVKNSQVVKVQNNCPLVTYSYVTKKFVSEFPDSTLIKNRKFLAMLKEVKGSGWGFYVRPIESQIGHFEINFRSTSKNPNVRLICEMYFSGGGHDRASGGRYILKNGEENWDTDQVCNKIIDILSKAEITFLD